MERWQSILLHNIVPSIFDSIVMLITVLVLFRLFRIKDPRVRFLFLFVPLIKSFIVLIESASHPWPPGDWAFRLGFRMPDPFNLIPTHLDVGPSPTRDTSVLFLVLLITVAAFAIILIIRWLQLWLFTNHFKKQEPISESKYPELYEILGKLAGKFGLNKPKMVFSNNYKYVPLSIGFRKPIIVLSEDLLNITSKEQLEIMLAHELAHIKRKDSTTGWITLMLRDTMFFNLIIHMVYKRIEEEREKACDIAAIEATGTSPDKVANTLLDIALFYSKAASFKDPAPALSKSFLNRETTLERRIKSIQTPVKKKRLPRLRAFICGFALVFLVYVQLYFIFNLGQGQTLWLR